LAPAGVGSRSSRWLFSEHFLDERLPAWPEFAALDGGDLHRELTALWAAERGSMLAQPNEGMTEERFVRPTLALLGHAFTLFAEIPGTGKTPDYFLYRSSADRQAAGARRR